MPKTKALEPKLSCFEVLHMSMKVRKSDGGTGEREGRKRKLREALIRHNGLRLRLRPGSRFHLIHPSVPVFSPLPPLLCVFSAQ